MTPHPGGKKDLLPTTTEDQDCNEVNPGYCFLGGWFLTVLMQIGQNKLQRN